MDHIQLGNQECSGTQTRVTGRMVREIIKRVPSIIERAVRKKEDKGPSLWLQGVNLGLKTHFSST